MPKSRVPGSTVRGASFFSMTTVALKVAEVFSRVWKVMVSV